MTNNIERQIVEIIATDRIDIPISSMSGKLKREKKKLAEALDLSEYENDFVGDRVYARVEEDETMKARGMKEGIDTFCEEYPRYGKILKGMVEAKRAEREVNLYFGMNDGCKLTSDDYLGVLTGLGFSELRASELYPELMKVSRNLSKKREEERSILIG